MYRHSFYLCTLATLAAVLCLLLAWGEGVRRANHQRDIQLATLSGALQLTDLALWTEARYTRNPALSDFFTPFQDIPGGPEHFPAGAIIAPPPHLNGRVSP